MPRGIEKQKMETKLTVVTMSCNGKQVNLFLALPIINNKSVLPAATFSDELGAEVGDAVSFY